MHRTLKSYEYFPYPNIDISYFTTNYAIQFFLTCVFGTQIKEMHLQPIPVKVKPKNKPYH